MMFWKSPARQKSRMRNWAARLRWSSSDRNPFESVKIVAAEAALWEISSSKDRAKLLKIA
jgi:hypothetical protein